MPGSARTTQPVGNRNATFGVQPSGAKQTDGRGFFNFGATPGARVRDYVAVRNYSLRPLILTMQTRDALNTPEGAFALLPPDKASKDVGSWIDLPVAGQKIVVPARGVRIFPFSVKIPANAIPGDHAGGITVTLESFARSQTGQQYRLLQSVGSRVFIRVSGPLHPGLSIEGLVVRYRGTINPIGRGLAVVSYTVRNKGNVAMGGRQRVRVSGLFGLSSPAVGLRDLGVLLPGSSVKQSVEVRRIFPQIWMSAAVSIEPLVLPGESQAIAGPYRASSHFWAVPWVLLGIVTLLILGTWRLVRRRRRRSPSGDKSQRPTLDLTDEDEPVAIDLRDDGDRSRELVRKAEAKSEDERL